MIINSVRWVLAIIAAILIWPIVIMITVTSLIAALTIGLISAIAICIYRESKE